MKKSKIQEEITRFFEKSGDTQIRPRKLARLMGVSEADYGDFRSAYKDLREAGRVVLGARGALAPLAAPIEMHGRFRAHPRGFGFVTPDDPTFAADLFVPEGETRGALTGDKVVARIVRRSKREGRTAYTGEVVQILERASSSEVGTLVRTDGGWLVIPDGRRFTAPIAVGDVPVEHRTEGLKVVVDIVKFPDGAGPASGVISDVLGPSGAPEAEILSISRAHGFDTVFPESALDEARAAARDFSPDGASDREDLTRLAIATIDPVDARDYDDAISVERLPSGATRLGVHIADVSHFVTPGGALDEEALRRGTSVYFPRRVIPMLPEVLSNGVCSLQEGVKRFARTAFIDYDVAGNPLKARFARSVIASSKRLTYEEAEEIAAGGGKDVPKRVRGLVAAMYELARRIEARREREGMLRLDLPEVDLVLDPEGRVVDGAPKPHIYSHRVIEMLMVEANEAVARALFDAQIPTLRRVHPEPSDDAFVDLAKFVRAMGHKIPSRPTRRDLQGLAEAVRGEPAERAVNIGILRSLQRAVYSTSPGGHFALASEHYCHFTSPIRRYPDLVVHRALDLLASGRRPEPVEVEEGEVSPLDALAAEMSRKERGAEAAEQELRLVLVLHHLATKVGEEIVGVVTGVADFGLFVQMPKFLVEGVVKLADLGDDWWEVSAERGTVRGETTGRAIRIGDPLPVVIAEVDVPHRRLVLVAPRKKDASRGKPAKNAKPANSARAAKPAQRVKQSHRGRGKGRG
jgi:ribonuclease R